MRGLIAIGPVSLTLFSRCVGIADPCEKDAIDACANLTAQEREDMTASAQVMGRDLQSSVSIIFALNLHSNRVLLLTFAASVASDGFPTDIQSARNAKAFVAGSSQFQTGRPVAGQEATQRELAGRCRQSRKYAHLFIYMKIYWLELNCFLLQAKFQQIWRRRRLRTKTPKIKWSKNNSDNPLHCIGKLLHLPFELFTPIPIYSTHKKVSLPAISVLMHAKRELKKNTISNGSTFSFVL